MKPHEKPSVGRLIESHPMWFGAFLGLVLVIGIMVTVIWFPWIDEDLGRHKKLTEGILYTGFAYVVCALVFQPLRRRSPYVFWMSLSIFFLVHSLGVFLYSTYAGTIRTWQWSILLYLEGYLAAFFVGWSTDTFGRGRRHNTR